MKLNEAVDEASLLNVPISHVFLLTEFVGQKGKSIRWPPTGLGLRRQSIPLGWTAVVIEYIYLRAVGYSVPWGPDNQIGCVEPNRSKQPKKRPAKE